MREPSGEANCVTGPQGKFNARNVGRFSCADAKATIKGILIAKQAPDGRRIWPASREFGCRASILVDRLGFCRTLLILERQKLARNQPFRARCFPKMYLLYTFSAQSAPLSLPIEMRNPAPGQIGERLLASGARTRHRSREGGGHPGTNNATEGAFAAKKGHFGELATGTFLATNGLAPKRPGTVTVRDVTCSANGSAQKQERRPACDRGGVWTTDEHRWIPKQRHNDVDH
jgi:hypothetical protein